MKGKPEFNLPSELCEDGHQLYHFLKPLRLRIFSLELALLATICG
jgi:hypothetical protein